MKRIVERWIAAAMGMILCICMCTGCGQDDGGQSENGRTETESVGGVTENSSDEIPLHMTADNSGDPTAERVPVLEGREPYDLLASPWQGIQAEEVAPVWWNQTAYRENLLQDPPDMTSTAKYRAVKDGAYYILATYDNIRAEEDGVEILYYLNRIDGDTLETECHRLYLEEMGLSYPFEVVSLDVAEDKPVVFGCGWDEESHRLTGYYGVWLDQEGHVESSLELLPALEEAGLVQEGGYPRRGAAKWDSRGYYCVEGADMSGRYAVIDPEGMLEMVLDPAKGLEDPNVCLYHDNQGRCIWEAASYKDLCNMFWCMDGGQQVKLYEGIHQNVGDRFINAYGDLYCVDEKNALVRWDASTGRCENLYLGVGASFKGYCALLQNSSGAIVLFYDDGFRDYLFQIANEEVDYVELTLACYSPYGETYTDTFVQEFNRTHEGVQINMQLADSPEEGDSYWARVQADLVAGHGPDLLLADREQMKILQEKGLLAELSEVVAQDVQQQIFPGVLENGMMGGGLYSISHTATTRGYVLFASKELCPTGTWTWEEVVALLEEQEQAGQPVRTVVNERSRRYLSTASDLLCDFFLADLEHCSLLDLENGKAYFDTEEFCHLLEVCKRYTPTENPLSEVPYTTENDQAAIAKGQLLEKETLCFWSSFWPGNFPSFSDDMADLGEDYHVVGFPTDGGSGRFIICYDGIAINAFSQHREVAAEFVNYILSRECQEEDYSVRRDICLERLEEPHDSYKLYGKPTVLWRKNGGVARVIAKPDGTSYLPEYLAMLDSCVPWSRAMRPIKNIIEEEVEAYFSGNKDARSVAGIIQSRVQLYLDENR